MDNSLRDLAISANSSIETPTTPTTLESLEIQASSNEDLYPAPHIALEDLSVELKVNILEFISDISSLHALVRASPLFYRAYFHRRKLILWTVLFNQFEHYDSVVLSEALAAQQASQITWEDSCQRRNDLMEFLTGYKNRSQTSTTANREDLDVDTLAAIAKRQLLINQLSSQFSRSRLSFDPVTGQKVEAFEPLSHTEAVRIQRALYRYELFCAVFPPNPVRGHRFLSDPLDAQEKAHYLLSLYQPWEVEEMICVHDYLLDVYRQILRDCLRELCKLWADSEDMLASHSPFSEMIRDSCTSKGLAFFHRMYQNPSASFRAKALIKSVANSGVHSNFYHALREDPYALSSATNLTRAGHNGDPLIFDGDCLSKPNAAWTWANENTMQIHYGELRNQSLQKWAYVMWDSERLEKLKVLSEDINTMREKEYEIIVV
ncbi:hypothetical protein ACMFMG_009952 [Clarireedia jacksonii]